MKITIGVQNTSHAGKRIDDDGSRDRWPDLVERITAVGADLWILNEVTGWDAPGAGTGERWPAAAAAADQLGLAVAGVTESKGNVPTAVLYRTETMGPVRWWDDTRADLWHNGAGVAVWDLPGLAAPLSIAGVHLTPFATELAIIEAKAIVSRAYRNGPYCLVGGDLNFPPLRGRAPDVANMRPYNKMNRLVEALADDPEPDRRVAQAMRNGGFHDAATVLYDRSRRAGRPDDELWDYTCDTDRIDRIEVAEHLAPAVESYRLLAEPPDASDHLGIVVGLDLSKAATSDLWRYK